MSILALKSKDHQYIFHNIYFTEQKVGSAELELQPEPPQHCFVSKDCIVNLAPNLNFAPIFNSRFCEMRLTVN